MAYNNKHAFHSCTCVYWLKPIWYRLSLLGSSKPQVETKSAPCVSYPPRTSGLAWHVLMTMANAWKNKPNHASTCQVLACMSVNNPLAKTSHLASTKTRTNKHCLSSGRNHRITQKRVWNQGEVKNKPINQSTITRKERKTENANMKCGN